VNERIDSVGLSPCIDQKCGVDSHYTSKQAITQKKIHPPKTHENARFILESLYPASTGGLVKIRCLSNDRT
jgi:hypothetical protein